MIVVIDEPIRVYAKKKIGETSLDASRKERIISNPEADGIVTKEVREQIRNEDLGLITPTTRYRTPQ